MPASTELSALLCIDALIVVSALKALADDGVIGRKKVGEAISRYGIDVDKADPVAV